MRFVCIMLVATLLLFGSYAYAYSYYSYDDVLLVVNNNSNVSQDIGSYFAEQRNITHIVYINCTEDEIIQNITLVENISTPIENYLTENNLEDSINYIVTTKGVPLIVDPDGGIYGYNTRRSVDSKLMLLLGNYSGYVNVFSSMDTLANPYYGAERRFSRDYYKIYLVTRLTGYNYTDVKQLIDNGNLSSTANNGTFVLDVDPDRDTGTYLAPNERLRDAYSGLTNKSWPVEFDNTSLFLVNRTGVLGYCSWGSNDHYDHLYTTNAIPNNTWLPGAIAETYVSTSARNFTWPPDYGQSLIADLIREGVSGAKGYVYEPTTSAVAHPNILFDRYTSGYNLADSFYMASPRINWMDVVVGDPKTAIKGALTIQVTQYPNQTRVNNGTLINFTVTDNRILVDLDSVWYYFNGTRSGNLQAPYLINLTGPYGMHEIALYANDTAGFIDIVYYDFEINVTAGDWPSAHTFNGNTTQFHRIENRTHVYNATIERTACGKIEFGEQALNFSGADLDAYVNISDNFISINSTALSKINASANLTLYGLAGFQYTPLLLRDGTYCSDCTLISFSGGTLRFNVSHFSSYSAENYSRMVSWDRSDNMPYAGETVYVHEQTGFFANYTNTTTGSQITSADCNVSFSGSIFNMTYNSSMELYTYNQSFNETASLDYNISCSKAGYGNLTSFATLQINNYPSNLTIWDVRDAGMPYGEQAIYSGETASFYANYTKALSGTPNDGAECTITFSGSDYSMLYNAATGFYIYSRPFGDYGMILYTVTCSASNFTSLSASDDITILLSQSTNGGSSGPSGGFSSGTPAPTTLSESKAIGALKKGETKRVTLDKSDTHSVTRIEITPNVDIEDAEIEVTKYISRPSGLAKPPLLAFRYLQIRAVNFDTEQDINSTVIRFMVNKTWLKANGIVQDSILLGRFHDEEWQELPTKKLWPTSTHIHYSAESPGFSYFAILANEQELDGHRADTETPTPPPEPQPHEAPPSEESEAGGRGLNEECQNNLLICAVLILTALGACCWHLGRRGKLSRGKLIKNRTHNKPKMRLLVSCALVLFLFFSLAGIGHAADVSSCGTISASSTLTADITDQDGDCFTIDTDNIIFDCQGYNVVGDDDTTGEAFYLNGRENVVIKNCNISGFKTAVYLRSSSGVNVTNVTATSSSSFGVYLRTVTNSVLSNITSISNSYSIYIASSSENNTISDVTMRSTINYGIAIVSSSSNTISNATINSGTYGIYLASASSNTISNATINSSTQGVSISHSPGNTLKNVSISNSSTYSLYVAGTSTAHFNQSIDFTNTIDNNPIYYLIGNRSQTFDIDSLNIPYFACISCDNITVRNAANMTKNNPGILFSDTNNSAIQNISVEQNYYGIYLAYSHFNTISNTTAVLNSNKPIYLYYSSHNTIIEATTNSNGNPLSVDNSPYTNATAISFTEESYGISLDTSPNSTLFNLNVSSTLDIAFYLEDSGDCTLYNITANSNSGSGIYLDTCPDSTLSNITANSNGGYGIYIEDSPRATIREVTASSNSNYDGLSLDGGTESTVEDATFNSNYYGIDLRSSYNCSFRNITTSFNIVDGTTISGIYYSNFTKITASSNVASGLSLGTTNNTLSNITSIFNGDYGIYISGDDHIIKDSNISSNNGSAFYFHSSESDNHIFNNTVCHNAQSFTLTPDTTTAIGNNTFCVDLLSPAHAAASSLTSQNLSAYASNLLNASSTNCTLNMDNSVLPLTNSSILGDNSTVSFAKSISRANYIWNVSCLDDYGNLGQSANRQLIIQRLDDSACAADVECSGGYCVHSICRATSAYCGDSYCDSGESCSSCPGDCGYCLSAEGTAAIGGTAAPAKTASPNLQKAKSVRASIEANTEESFPITKEGLDITEIRLKSREAAENVVVAVEELDASAVGTPVISGDAANVAPSAPAPRTTVYQYLEVTTSNLKAESIDAAIIDFTVPKSWVTENKIDKSTITLNRYTSKWAALKTSIVREGAEYIYLEAETPGFSTFAITGDRVSEEEAPEVEPQRPEPAEGLDEPEREEGLVEVPAGPEATEKGAGESPLYFYGVVLVILLAAGYWNITRRN